MEDHEIIALYIKRDEQAVAETQRAYGSYCFAIANNILHCDADTEETVSDTWLQAWNTIPPKRPVSLKHYLARITRNLALSRWRTLTADKRGGGQVLVALEELGDCVSGSQDASEILDIKELGRAISVFLQRENPRDRAIFLRRYFYLEDTDEIADRFRLTSSHVLQILSRTRRKLENYLNKEGYAL